MQGVVRKAPGAGMGKAAKKLGLNIAKAKAAQAFSPKPK